MPGIRDRLRHFRDATTEFFLMIVIETLEYVVAILAAPIWLVLVLIEFNIEPRRIVLVSRAISLIEYTLFDRED